MNSYTHLSAKKVKAACEKYLAARLAGIDAKREEKIERLMTKGFKCLRAKTREEAIERLKAAGTGLDFISAWEKPALSGSLWAGKVESLLDIANVAEMGLVCVSANDFSLIADYYE